MENDLISRSRLSGVLEKNFGEIGASAIMQQLIDIAPAVDAVPVVHGWWIADMRGQATMICHCSNCGCQKALIDGNYTMFKYCSDCGAKMDGKAGDNQ